MDLGLIGEYAYDERGDSATTAYEDDAMFGLRLAVNDADGTELLAGLIQDLDSRARALSIEASRRFGSNWKLSLQAWGFLDSPMDDLLFNVRGDDFLQVELASTVTHPLTSGTYEQLKVKCQNCCCYIFLEASSARDIRSYILTLQPVTSRYLIHCVTQDRIDVRVDLVGQVWRRMLQEGGIRSAGHPMSARRSLSPPKNLRVKGTLGMRRRLAERNMR
jgi:hypothetical protein